MSLRKNSSSNINTYYNNNYTNSSEDAGNENSEFEEHHNQTPPSSPVIPLQNTGNTAQIVNSYYYAVYIVCIYSCWLNMQVMTPESVPQFHSVEEALQYLLEHSHNWSAALKVVADEHLCDPIFSKPKLASDDIPLSFIDKWYNECCICMTCECFVYVLSSGL